MGGWIDASKLKSITEGDDDNDDDREAADDIMIVDTPTHPSIPPGVYRSGSRAGDGHTIRPVIVARDGKDLSLLSGRCLARPKDGLAVPAHLFQTLEYAQRPPKKILKSNDTCCRDARA